MKQTRRHVGQQFYGFTLTELVIALGILGIIAAFTIPKILDSGTDGKYNSIAKETIASISEAYQAYTIDNSLGYVNFNAFTPYLNYVSVDTAGTNDIDDHANGGAALTCDAGNPCLRLHNGAVLMYDNVIGFCDNDPNLSGISGIHIDPDGTANGTESIEVYLYDNGTVMLAEDARTGDEEYDNTGGGSCDNALDPVANSTPSWFSWQ